MKTKNIFALGIFALLMIGFVSAGSCDYPEFRDDDTDYIFGDSSLSIRAGSDEKIKYDLDDGTIFLGVGGSTSQCKSAGGWGSVYRGSGTLYPGERKTFSLNSNECYRLELEYYDCFECDSGDDDCDDYEYLECIGGNWDNQGEIMGECDVECFDGQDKCSQYNFYTCDDFEWDNDGKVAGECGVECVVENDCSGNDVCENNVCEQNPCDYLDCSGKCESGKLYSDGTCNYATGKCEFESPSTCEFGCDRGDCAADPCLGVTCEDKCSGNVKSNMGYCSGGQCVYQTNTCEFGCSAGLCKQNPCLGVDTSDRCEDGRWKHDGRCDNGNVFYDAIDICTYGCEGEPVPILAAIIGGDWCRDSPCSGVVCDDYCSGTTKMTDGTCNSGKCVYSGEVEYNKDCGHVPFYKTTPFLAGMGIFAFLFILISGLIFRGRKKR